MNDAATTRVATGNYVPIRHDGQVHKAFVPDPLPPDLAHDDDLWNALSAADRALANLSGKASDMTNPRLFVRPLMRQEAVSSSRIEGTRADLTDLYAFEAGQISFADLAETPDAESRREQDVREVHNYVRALEYGLSRLDDLPISKRLFCELHHRLMQGVRGEHRRPGEFREIQSWIAAHREAPLAEAEYVPPPVGKMHEALDDLEEYLNSPGRYPPLIRAGLAHYQFEAIHPFIDGNGRVGRLLITLELIHWGILPVPLLYLSICFERHRDQYIASLRQLSREAAWKEWLLFFLEGVREQSHRALQTAQTLDALKNRWRSELARENASSSALTLVEHLFEQPVLSVPQAQEVVGLTYNAARYNVQKLRDKNILKELPVDAHPTLYYAPAILSVVTPGPDREAAEGEVETETASGETQETE